MPLGATVALQQFQGLLRQGHRTVLAALAVAHPDQHPLAVDILRLHAHPFGNPQATAVDQGQGHLHDGVVNITEDRLHFPEGEDHGEFFALGRPHQVEQGQGRSRVFS